MSDFCPECGAHETDHDGYACLPPGRKVGPPLQMVPADELETLRARVRDLESAALAQLANEGQLLERVRGLDGYLTDAKHERSAALAWADDLLWDSWCLAWGAIGYAHAAEHNGAIARDMGWMFRQEMKERDRALEESRDARIDADNLRAERDLALAGAGRMREALEQAMSGFDCPGEGHPCVCATINEALSSDAGRAELERRRELEGALQEVAGGACDTFPGCGGECKDVARAALSGKGTR